MPDAGTRHGVSAHGYPHLFIKLHKQVRSAYFQSAYERMIARRFERLAEKVHNSL
jgi:hypothetical protein